MMTSKKTLLTATTIAILLLSSSSGAYAQGFTNFDNNQNQGYNPYGNYNQGYNNNYNQGYGYSQANDNQLAPLEGRIMTVQPGTSLGVALNNTISSEYSRVGEPVTARLANDFYYAGTLALPAGSMVQGQVTDLKKAGRAEKNGYIGIRFTSATTPDGRVIPLSARIATEDGTGLIKGGTSAGSAGRVVGKTAAGAAGGALAGLTGSAISGGRKGKGTAIGTAIGGGIGLISGLAGRGEEAVIPSGERFNIILDQPMTIPGATNYAPPGGYNNQYPPQYQQPQDNSYPY